MTMVFPAPDFAALSTFSDAQRQLLAQAKVLIVGAGGLGCAAAAALAGTPLGKLTLVDEDVVDESNLHRQILYHDADVGRMKLQAAADSLCRRGMKREQLELRSGRFLPEVARQWVRAVDVVMEGVDNYATKFLVADACRLEQRTLVHGAAVGWQATVWSVLPLGQPCYRCLFEDIPPGPTRTCDSAGVRGPVVGVAGALMAVHVLRALLSQPFAGLVHTFEGKTGRVRAVSVPARPDCPLCGARATIRDVREARYVAPQVPSESVPDMPFNPHLS